MGRTLWYVSFTRALLAGALFFVACFAYPTPSEAQFTIGTEGFALETNPRFPQPKQEVIVRLNDYSVSAIGAEVFWFINGTELKAEQNNRSITVVAGSLGESITIRAALRGNDGAAFEATATIIPTAVDLILEANTYTPSFYQGRALPSRASTVRAVAVVHSGDGIPDTLFTYRWELGEEVLFAGPARGRNTVTIPMPLFSKRLSVEVIDLNGQVIGRSSMMLEATTPEMHFYEWSPLRGLYQRSLSNQFPLIGDETVVYAEPYFIQRAPTPDTATLTWRMNGTSVRGDTTAPHALVLNRENIQNTTRVLFTLLTKDQVPQKLEKGFTVIPN